MSDTRLNQFRRQVEKRLTPELIRYFVMAVSVVLIELITFQLIIWAHISYLIATPASMLLGIVLNWYFSQRFVFNHRPHSPKKEFTLVLIASLIGIGLQTAVTAGVVEVLKLAPIIGKMAAIVVTFFWNFWFRKKYVFYGPADAA
jgi:putative flippase GtrA